MSPSVHKKRAKAFYLLGEKNVADALTMSRLYAIIPISAAVVAGWEVLTGVLYVLAMLTDALDGWVARRQKTASQRGADLDGVVDFWFSTATLWWLWVLRPEIYTTYGYAILLGVLAFAAFMLVSYYYQKRIVMLHLVSAKITTFLFALWLPLVVFWYLPGWLIYLTLAAVVISRAQNTYRVVAR